MEKRIKERQEENTKKNIRKNFQTSVRPKLQMLNTLEKRGFQKNTKHEDIPQEKLAELYLDLEINKTPGTKFGKDTHERKELTNIARLIKINAYRGRRLKLGYPANGQRTRRNAKTAKISKSKNINSKS